MDKTCKDINDHNKMPPVKLSTKCIRNVDLAKS